MKNDEITRNEAANDPHAPVIHGQGKTAKAEKADDEQLKFLSIDENDDFGGDPYNHTGSFCVPKFDD
jgi:hypothetical protein